LQAQIKVAKINEHRNTTEELTKEDKDEPTGLEIAGEAKAAMHYVNEMKEDIMD